MLCTTTTDASISWYFSSDAERGRSYHHRMDSEVSVGLWPDGERHARRVLVLPGGRYGIDRPGLMWPARALTLHGWEVWAANWHMPMDQPVPERKALVLGSVEEFVSRTGGPPHLVVAKSVGTYAAGWVADHDVPAVWTTPLLTDDECVADIARASSAALLVAGTIDHTWDDDGARRTGKTSTKIHGADHGWETGDWRTELDAISALTGVVEEFASAISVP